MDWTNDYNGLKKKLAGEYITKGRIKSDSITKERTSEDLVDNRSDIKKYVFEESSWFDIFRNLFRR